MSDSSPNISVIICTYNRADSLKRTLDHIKKLTVPEGMKWELLIVDNNSKDNTREVVDDFIVNSFTNCKYIFENKQGLSHARNSGITNAAGEIIVFTDDDVIVDENWLKNISAAFNSNNISCVGGKILPFWEKPCPKWLKGELFNYIALCDLGEEVIKLSEPKVWGANISIRASIFRRYGLFDTSLGHTGGKLYGGEETRYLNYLLKAGEAVLYCPDILVYHCIPEYRLKKDYFRKWVSDKGELNAIQMGEYENRHIFGIPLIFFRRTMRELIRFIRSQVVDPENAFHNDLNLHYQIGMIKGRIRYNKGKMSLKGKTGFWFRLSILLGIIFSSPQFRI